MLTTPGGPALVQDHVVGRDASSSSRVGNRPSFSRVGNAYRATIHVPLGWTFARSAKYVITSASESNDGIGWSFSLCAAPERMDVAVVQARAGGSSLRRR